MKHYYPYAGYQWKNSCSLNHFGTPIMLIDQDENYYLVKFPNYDIAPYSIQCKLCMYTGYQQSNRDPKIKYHHRSTCPMIFKNITTTHWLEKKLYLLNLLARL